MTRPYGDSTRCVHAGRPPAAARASRSCPGRRSRRPSRSTRPTGPVPGVDSYGRPDSSTRRLLEAAIGELEGGDCLTFATGMAAVSAVAAGPGPARATRSCCRPTATTRPAAWAAEALAPLRRRRSCSAPTAGPYPSFDGRAAGAAGDAGQPGPRRVRHRRARGRAPTPPARWSRSTTPPRPRSARRRSTLGADLVVASGTKALTGHSDVLLGYVATRDDDLLAAVRAWRDATGAIPGDFDAWLAHRSLATLDLRLARQTANAAAVAEVLAGHPAVRSVRWPGPAGRSVLCGGARGRCGGSRAWSRSRSPSAEAVGPFLRGRRLVIAATSFGGLHTTADRRAQWGDDAPAGLVRLSCGIEDADDLVADILSALDSLRPESRRARTHRPVGSPIVSTSAKDPHRRRLRRAQHRARGLGRQRRQHPGRARPGRVRRRAGRHHPRGSLGAHRR